MLQNLSDYSGTATGVQSAGVLGAIGTSAGELLMEKSCNLCGWCVALTLLVCATAWAQTTYPVPQIANPLVPDAVVPGSPAFTLTVNGTGFVSGSTVYWNGSPRTTAYVSAAQLTATINASDVATANTGSVTVHSPSGTISNAMPLVVTIPELSMAFGGAEINTYGGDVLSADMNGDGNPDLVVDARTFIEVALGVGNGSFQPATDYTQSGNPSGLNGTTLADFNNDGFPDVAYISIDPNAIQIMLNNESGGLITGSSLNVSSDTYFNDSTAAADFNGDGNLDLVFPANMGVGVTLGNGDGTFQSPFYIPLTQDSYWVAVGDFNRDGIPDIVASLNNYEGFAVLLGNGDGTFAAPAYYANGIATHYLAVADLNGDGYPDLIAADINTNSFYMLLNAGNGTLLPAVQYQGPESYVYFDGIVAGDMNGDGKLDLVLQAASNCGNNCFEVFLGNGDGTLQPGEAFGVVQNIGCCGGGEISLADFNHDGKLDVGTQITDQYPYLMIQMSGPAPTMSPGVLSFASQAVGSQSPSQTVTLLQPGSTNIAINSVSASGDFQTNGGCVGYALPPGNTYCGFTVTFSPSTTGVRTGQLTLNSSGGTQYVYLTGTGTAANKVTVSPASIGFGTELLGTTSYQQTVTIANIGSQIVTFTSVAVVGANPSDFLVNDLCGSTLAVGASCSVQVSFHPTKPGARAASLNITDSAVTSPQSVTLSGTGNALFVSNTLLDFGDVNVGSSSSEPVELRNLGPKPISIIQVKIGGRNPSSFSQTNTCGASIPAKGSCEFTVKFTPQTQGLLDADLDITTNGSGTNAITAIALSGHGEQ